MKRDIEFDALQKFWLTPPRVFDFETLRALKYSGDGGYLLELQKLYAGMFAEWDTLRKDVTTLMGAVAALDWRVVPYVEKGKKPDAKAQKVADVISRAIWARGKQKPGTYAHTFLQMVGAMAVDGLTRGVNVHELLLERLPDGTIAAPFYGHVFPNYYMWENRERHDDRLMMVRDGMSFSDPEPFPENKFIIALNTQGSDHPMYNSVYASLLGYFGAAKWGLPWLQEYCRRYGHDIKKFTVQTDEQENRLREQLAQGDDPTEVFLRDGADMEVTPIPGAAGNPYEVLLKIAENHCHQAILGQTLTSDTGDSGGSRAQAEVHMGVQKDVVLHYAEYAAGVLNAQLIPALVELNFGKGEVPMPELQFSIPDGGVSTEVAQYWQAVLQIPGMRVAKEEVYESLRISMPADGADVFETPGAAAAAGEGSKQNARQSGESKQQGEDDDDDPEPPDNGGDKPKDGGEVTAARGDSNAEDALMQQVDKMAAEGMRQWAAPVVEGLQKMLDAGVPMATIRERLPELVPDTEALAEALTDVFRLSLGVSEGDVAAAQGKQFTDAEIQRYVDYYHASLTEDGDYRAGRFMRNHNIPDVPHEQVMAFLRRQKEQSANVEAANPYGCNQYGEGWREPHEGNSTSNVPGAGKVTTHVDENGNVTQKTALKKPGEKDYTSDRKPIVNEEQQKKIDEGAEKKAQQNDEDKKANRLISLHNIQLLNDGNISVRSRRALSQSELKEIKEQKENIVRILRRRKEDEENQRNEKRRKEDSLPGRNELTRARENRDAAESQMRSAESARSRRGNEEDWQNLTRARARFEQAQEDYEKAQKNNPQAAAYEKYEDMGRNPNINTSSIGRKAAQKILNGESAEEVEKWVEQEKKKNLFRD